MDMRSQSLGELLAKLERSGLITRTPSDADRRVMNIRLTPEGMEAANQTAQMQEDVLPFDCLNADEQTSLSEYLDRIIEQLEKKIRDGYVSDLKNFWDECGDAPLPDGGRGHCHHMDPRLKLFNKLRKELQFDPRFDPRCCPGFDPRSRNHDESNEE